MRTEAVGEARAVARLGSFSAAAKELHLARSALAAHMDSLEAELGFRVFDREPRASLTVAGAAFLEGAEKAVALIDETAARCRLVADSGGEQGQAPAVRVAAAGATPKMLARLKACTRVPLRFVRGSYPAPFFSAIEQGQADVLLQDDFRDFPDLAARAEELGLDCLDLGPHPLLLVMGASNPLAAQIQDGGLPRRALNGAELAIFQSIGYDRAVEEYRRVIGGDVRLTSRFIPMDEISGWVSLDLGGSVAVVWTPEADQFLQLRDDLATVSKLDGKPLSRPSVAVWRKEGASPGVRQFARDLARLASEGEPIWE